MHASLIRAAIAALAFLVWPACSSEAQADMADVLVFTAIPDHNETELREKYAPVASYLSEKLGVEVRYLHSTSYADSVELFKNGDVQLAWFGGLSGVQARHAVPGARAIAQGLADIKFHSYFIAHRDTGLTRSGEFPEGLRGKKFTFGSSGSTSGRLLPEHFIRQNTGQSPAEFFGMENRYSGSHDATVEHVESGAFEAGAVNYKTYDARGAQGKTDPEVCRIIWKTPPYVDYNFTAHPALDERFGAGFIDRLQAVLLAMDDPDLLAAFPRERLIEAKNSDYDSIRALALDLGFIRE